jgi:hypothetical protein
LPTVLKYTVGLIALCCAIGFTHQLQAQGLRPMNTGAQNFDNARNNSGSDTSKLGNKKKKGKDNSIIVRYNTLANLSVQVPDSSIEHIYRIGIKRPFENNLGNVNSATHSLVTIAPTTAQRNLGMRAFLDNNTALQDLPFYNTSKAYTLFTYDAGGKQMQGAGIVHSQNIGGKGNITGSYSKIASPGYYQTQRTAIDKAWMTLTLNHKKLKALKTQAAVLYHEYQQDENGGILADSLLIEPAYTIRSTVPTVFGTGGFNSTRSSIINKAMCLEATLRNQYLLTKDSARQVNANAAAIAHSVNVRSETYRYRDNSPSLQKYLWLDSIAFNGRDTVRGLCQLTSIQNEIGLSLPNWKALNMRTNAAYGTEFQWFNNGQKKPLFVNQYVRAQIQTLSDSAKWFVQASTQLYFTGIAAGNFIINGALSRKISNWKLRISAQQSLVSPDVMFTNFRTNFYEISTSLDKVAHTTIGANVQHTKHQLNVGLRQHTIFNYVYYTDSLNVQQYNQAILITEATSNIKFKYKKWLSTHDVLVQIKNNEAPINLPNFAIRSTVAYQSKMFKGSTNTCIGLEGFYNTGYNAPAYNVFNANYFYANNFAQSMYPRLTAFLTAQVSRCKIYVAADELLQPLGTLGNTLRSGYKPNIFTNILKPLDAENRIAISRYPYTDLMFRAGFSWTMVN